MIPGDVWTEGDEPPPVAFHWAYVVPPEPLEGVASEAPEEGADAEGAGAGEFAARPPDASYRKTFPVRSAPNPVGRVEAFPWRVTAPVTGVGVNWPVAERFCVPTRSMVSAGVSCFGLVRMVVAIC